MLITAGEIVVVVVGAALLRRFKPTKFSADEKSNGSTADDFGLEVAAKTGFVVVIGCFVVVAAIFVVVSGMVALAVVTVGFAVDTGPFKSLAS